MTGHTSWKDIKQEKLQERGNMSYENEDQMFEAIGADGHIIRFAGELVSHVSAHLPEKDRWTEFSLYLTASDTWVLQGVGRSRVPGETDRYWSVITSDPSDWIDKIIGDDVSRLAKRLLKDSFLYLRNCD